ncbi:MAG TPA: hypothetical protein VF712_09460 [Thermoleophilaceae bacterium]
MTVDSQTNVRGPFGAADASREDPRDASASFIDFAGAGGIATRHDDLRARVIVGRKGAGKTLYLRRARTHAADTGELYADDIQQNLPTTSDIVAVANCYPLGVLTEKWMAIWRCAILRSLASHMLRNERLESKLSERDQELLTEGFGEVLGHAATSITPLSVYSQVRDIINDGPINAERLNRQVSHRQWEELEYKLGELLSRYPAICFYLDAVDEEFRHAPAYWMMCQKGLFYQVMRLLRDTRLGGRLHVFISIRDHVYTSVFGSEHATRYLDPVFIRLLEWDSESIGYFLEEKVRRLPLRWHSGGDSTVGTWLGVTGIYNERRRVTESPARYLLRHTRLLPRDIVVLGNQLCERMRTRDGSVRPLTDTEIRQVVHHCARVFGREQLAICANQIAADMMHEGAALQEISDIYTASDSSFTGADVYQEDVRSKLEKFICSIGRDRFSRETFSRASEQGSELFDGHTDVMAVLWQNGLLGQVPAELKDDGRAIFYSAASHHELRIDDAAGTYALHPCLIDALDLKSEGAGSNPIVPVSSYEI